MKAFEGETSKSEKGGENRGRNIIRSQNKRAHSGKGLYGKLSGSVLRGQKEARH